MKFMLEIDITSDGVQDYDDLSEQMLKLRNRLRPYYRDNGPRTVDILVGDGEDILDCNRNHCGNWKIVE